MTGPEHYTEAERLIRLAGKPYADPADDANLIGQAQVHATLALAAVTAVAGRMPGKTTQTWDKVTGVTA